MINMINILLNTITVYHPNRKKKIKVYLYDRESVKVSLFLKDA